jgi:hypothetical protein
MNTNKNLCPETLELIKEAISVNLIKRGFHAPIELTGGMDRRGFEYKLALTSEPFQTTPVLFKEIRISDFGSWVKSDTTDAESEGLLNVGVRVHVSYEHFDGGRNGCELFTFTCQVRAEDKHIYKAQVF